MKKLMSTIGILALLVGTGFAQEKGAPECDYKAKAHVKHGKHGKQRAMLEDLPGVTDEQKTQMKEIRIASRERLKSQHESLKAVREKLGDLKTSENPNLKEINQLIDEMHLLQAEMDKAKAASHLKALSVLTPEQRKAFTVKMEEKRVEREKMHKQRKAKRELKEAK
jgi:Spy/CpxP family protein refolding chaperone